MQSASQKYKEVKAQKYVDQVSYMRISIGVVNQEAQSTATDMNIIRSLRSP